MKIEEKDIHDIKVAAGGSMAALAAALFVPAWALICVGGVAIGSVYAYNKYHAVKQESADNKNAEVVDADFTMKEEKENESK